MSENQNSSANITVIGVGNSGIKTINSMIDAQIMNVNFLSVSLFDLELKKSKASNKLLLAEKTVNPKTNKNSDILSDLVLSKEEELALILKDTNIVFLVGGMGGVTATAVMPLIASCVKKMNILTIAITTKPYSFEGSVRARTAKQGLVKLSDCVDTLIIIANDNLKKYNGGIKNLKDAFFMVDQVLIECVKNIASIISTPGLIKIDFSDLSNAMTNAGYANIGFSEASGKDKAKNAAMGAINNPILDCDLSKAKEVVINVTANSNISLDETEIVTNLIVEKLNENTNIYFSLVIDDNLGDTLKVAIIAIGDTSHILMFDEDLKVIYNEPKNKDDKSFESILELFKNPQ